jgi:hypothetical protein
MGRMTNPVMWLLSLLPSMRKLHAAVIGLARAAQITLSPKQTHTMRLEHSAMLAIIAAAAKIIPRAKQAMENAIAALEPLKRENEQYRIQLQQLETADAQLDEALTELRDVLPAEEIDPLDDGTPELPVNPVIGEGGEPVTPGTSDTGPNAAPPVAEPNPPGDPVDLGTPNTESTEPEQPATEPLPIQSDNPAVTESEALETGSGSDPQ